MLHDRPKDAYAALKFLQARDDVQPNRIGVVGWSQGGATILRAIASNGNARPETLEHDFRAALFSLGNVEIVRIIEGKE